MSEQNSNSIFTRPAVVGVLAVVALVAGVSSALFARSSTAESVEQNRGILQEMPAEDKAALQERRNRFLGMSQQEQDDLVATYNEIEASPDRDQLHATMTAYYGWLKSLDSYDRRSLRDTSVAVETRIARVTKVRLEQVSSLPLRDRPDFDFFADWLRKYVLVHVDVVEPAEYDTSWERTWALAFIKWINGEMPGIPEPTVEMYSELASRLGVESEFRESGLLEEDRAEERKELVADRLYRLLFTGRSRGRGGRGGPRILDIDPDDLLKFLASDRLPAEAKARLSSLDLLRQNRLLTYYFLKDRDPDWWQRLGMRGGRGGRGGRGSDDDDNRRGRDGGRGDGGRNEENRGDENRGAGDQGNGNRAGDDGPNDLPPAENPRIKPLNVQLPEVVLPII